MLGFVAAVLTAKLLKSSILKSERMPFVLEMPPYRWPTLRSLSLRLIDRSKVFLRRAGTVILLVIVVLWVLENLPVKNGQPPEIADSFAGMIGHAVEPVIKPLGFNWKIGIGLVSSIAAREVIVGTLGTIYGKEGTSQSMGLQPGAAQRPKPGRRHRAAGLLRVRHAMHVHARRSAPRNRRLEVASPAVFLYDAAGVPVRTDHQ